MRTPSISCWLVVAIVAAAACGSQATSTPDGGTGGHGGTVITITTSTTSTTTGPHVDFPEDPIVDPALPAGVPGLFGAAGSDTGGPCLAEPALDAMVPKNWTPLSFEWTPASGQNVFELRLSVKDQVNDLVVYTAGTSFTIDAATWEGLTAHNAGDDIQVTLRGGVLDAGVLTAGPFVGAKGAVHIAPVDAAGSVVYWDASNGTSFEGFTVGDVQPLTVLTPATAGVTSTGGTTTCVSCHASSPDGELLVYSRDADNGTRAVDVRRVDNHSAPSPNDVSQAALALLGRHKQTAPVLSPAHYSAADAVVIAVFSDPTATGGRYELAWTDLHAADANGWGILKREGDAKPVASPSWRHDGTAVAYVSASSTSEGVIADGADMDIYTVPYNDRQGGAATPLPGASDPAYREFYPVYAPGDGLLAFNRTDQPVNSYNQPSAEILVVPGAGGTALRLRANDPPQCTGYTSPGLTNSWARWAPKAEAFEGRRYYWLVFSSKRHGDGTRPQLYISSIVTEVVGGVETIVKDYPALYVTSQNAADNNHTPAWDVFQISGIPR